LAGFLKNGHFPDLLELKSGSNRIKQVSHRAVFVRVMQELKEFLNRVGEVTFADAHKEHMNEG